MTEPEHIIKTIGLSKNFKQVRAVDNLDLTVNKGDIYGFLGPNGAGKTTTIKMILDLVRSDAGDIWLNGVNIADNGVSAREGIGYLPERAQFYKNLTAIQTMEFFAELKGVDKEQCDELLAKVGMDRWRDKKLGTFSKGMVQLVGVGQALLGDPKLLILDEPTSGLDPRWSRVLKDIMLEMNGKGTTIFFSSHLLSEVQELCNRVAILNQGHLIIEDTVAHVSGGLTNKPKLVIRVTNNAEKAVQAIRAGGFDEVEVHGNQISVLVESQDKSKILSLLSEAEISIEDFKTIEPSLEDAFMSYIGDEAIAGGVIE